ncbi:MAG TPA: hypothetical protein VFM06_07705 [Candidatus Limnocylindria bacterium]|nr:hypothetical protein [Candidatus Limnocylindria bacterium]
MRRPWILILAALTLAAPGCPRQSGPGDYDPDATRPFAPYPAESDLGYLSAASSRGDVVYVVAASTGAVVGRVDGPDRTSWVTDTPGRTGYYAVTRREGFTTLHRIDLRTGARRMLARDDRGGRSFAMPDDDGWRPTSLAVSADGAGLLVARALATGALWVGRYDTTTGALTAERSWPLADAATVRFDPIGLDRFAVVAFETRDGAVVRQQLHVVDANVRVVADLAAADLPDATPCASRLVRVAEGWGTVCAWRNDRYPTVLTLDQAFGKVRSVMLTLGSAEQVRAFAPAEGGIGVLTDRGRWALVRDAPVPFGELRHADGRPIGSAVLRAIGASDRAVVLADVVVTGDTTARTIALIDLRQGRVLAERQFDGLVGAALGRELYVLTGIGGDPGGARVGRYDRATLAPRGPEVTVPRLDETSVFGIALVVPP